VDKCAMEKINAKIDYPMILNLTKYYPHYIDIDNENNTGIYKLNSVVNQIGANNYGHYFAFTYDVSLDKWLNCNDERVSVIDEINVINSPNAYLLFYQQIK
jgi:ubiquitin C-terminal hydrolase